MKQNFYLFTFFMLFSMSINAQTTNGLIYNFKFDGSTTDSLSTTAFTTANAATYITDRFGNANSALNVNSTTQATLSNIPLGSSARTVSVWMYFNSLPITEQYILSYGTNTTSKAFGLSAQVQSNTIKYYGWSNDLPANYIFTKKNWYHILLTYDGVNATAYINGARLISQSLSSWSTVGNIFRLAESPAGAKSLNISFDDLRIYNRVLNSQEIADISAYPFNSNGLRQSTLGYYNFDNSLSNQNNTLALTNYNNVTLTAGKYGNAATFAGNNALYSSDYATNIENSTAASFTISFWKKDLTSSNTYQTLFELFGNYFLRYRSAGVAESGFQFAGTTTWSNNTTAYAVQSVGIWQHMCMVHDVENATDMLYLNGQPVLTYANMGYKMNKAIPNISFGGGFNSNGVFDGVKFYAGQIDELYIIQKAVPAAEIPYLVNLSTNFMATSVSELKASETKVFPNPCTDVVNFSDSRDMKKELFNIQGTKIASTFENSLNTNSLPAGIYIVKFSDKNNITGFTRFIKK